jgi:hypothetical protein
VRLGERVFASGLETLKGVKPLNNVRWLLFERTAEGWTLRHADPKGRTREPCPLVGFPDGRLFLSANPPLAPPEAAAGPERPEILQFAASNAAAPPTTLLPVWDGSPPFCEHSYRSFAADGPGGELVLFQNIGYAHAEWAFRDREGRWAAKGKLAWPFGAEHAKPQPIRVCYPTVALVKRAVHFCGVSDIVEPNEAWRAAKRQLTGQDWDYDFRRLFYTWTPDITSGKFRDWVEVASREKTCGWMMPADLWVAPDGAVHLLWTERAIDERLRAKFFPDTKQSYALNHAVVRDGKVTLRHTLVEATETGSHEVASAGRFHATPDGRLFVFCYVSGQDAAGKPVSENRLMEVRAEGTAGPPVHVPLRQAFASFFTATPRGGSALSPILDVLGERVGSAGKIGYARIRLL